MLFKSLRRRSTTLSRPPPPQQISTVDPTARSDPAKSKSKPRLANDKDPSKTIITTTTPLDPSQPQEHQQQEEEMEEETNDYALFLASARREEEMRAAMLERAIREADRRRREMDMDPWAKRW